MELIFVRHCDPDYEKDSLTDVGLKEANILSERIKKIDADAYYCSPMGRAKLTAEIALSGTGIKPQILDWLHEYKAEIEIDGKRDFCWDMLPSFWTKEKDFYGYDWYKLMYFENTNVLKENEKIYKGIDCLLESYGYIHEDNIFRVTNSNHKKIVFFCHFGIECVILGHLLHISPIILLHNFSALPSSVTRIVTEEREKGIAAFRLLYFGDISHLYKAGQEPSFAARFCECYDDDTRH